jgi:hypothetical protein
MVNEGKASCLFLVLLPYTFSPFLFRYDSIAVCIERFEAGDFLLNQERAAVFLGGFFSKLKPALQIPALLAVIVGVRGRKTQRQNNACHD